MSVVFSLTCLYFLPSCNKGVLSFFVNWSMFCWMWKVAAGYLSARIKLPHRARNMLLRWFGLRSLGFVDRTCWPSFCHVAVFATTSRKARWTATDDERCLHEAKGSGCQRRQYETEWCEASWRGSNRSTCFERKRLENFHEQLTLKAQRRLVCVVSFLILFFCFAENGGIQQSGLPASSRIRGIPSSEMVSGLIEMNWWGNKICG